MALGRASLGVSKTKNYRPFFTLSVRRNDEDIPVRRESESAAYEGSGKTEITLLNEMAPIMMIDTYSQIGFRVNGQTLVVGPMAIFPNAILSWKVKFPTDIDERALSLFTVLEPKPDLVIIGYGNSLPVASKRKASYDVLTVEEEKGREEEEKIRIFNANYTKRVNKHFARMSLLMKSKGLNVTFLPTQDAVSTYNYLVNGKLFMISSSGRCNRFFLFIEQRLVAGALIPPHHVMDQNPEIMLGYNLAIEGEAVYGGKVNLMEGQGTSKNDFS